MIAAPSRFAGSLIFFVLSCEIAAGQATPLGEEGIPVSDALVIAKCGKCHARDERGNMERISWARTTPEAWQGVLKRMIVGFGVSMTPAEARSIVKYLSASHGLAPEEARTVLYDAERRIREETGLPRGELGNTCTRCHAFARALSWRRPAGEWRQFAESHAARYQTPGEATAALLAKAAPLHTPEWDAWGARKLPLKLAGRWLVTASMAGHGKYYGEMQVDPAGDDEFDTRVTLTSIQDGSTIARSGRGVVYGGYAWRGRSKGTRPASGTPDDLASEVREVLWISPDQSTAEGRWFWGQYQEFGFDVTLRRASATPTLLAIDKVSLKTDSRVNSVRVTGDNFPAEIAPADLNLGAGVIVRRIVSHAPSEVTAEVDVEADAPLGRRDVVVWGSVMPRALAIYDRVDYVKVTPESALATFSDAAHSTGYQQFEAIAYQRGSDGKLHTADDVELGPLEAAWSLEVFYAADGTRSDLVGAVSPTGFLTPASPSPGNNFDVWVVATAKNEKDQNDRPLIGKAYVVVTVPAYTFNGRRYVRDLNKWIDDGPVTRAQQEKP